MMTTSEWLNTVAQVGAGLVAVIVVYYVCQSIASADGLLFSTASNAERKKTTILDGVVDASQPKQRDYNTVLPIGSFLPYANVRQSVNRKGGAQFTYSFWLYVDNITWIHKNDTPCNIPTTTTEGLTFDPKHNPRLYTLFVKGDKRCYQYQLQDLDNTGNPLGSPVNRQGRYVMCPLIALGDPSDKEIWVYFNTLGKIDQCIKLKATPSLDSTLRRNISTLTEKQWTMYTFTFMDYIPMGGFDSMIVINSYINDVPYQTDQVPGALRCNDGELCVLPDGAPGANTLTASRLLMSTFDYYNYALSNNEVAARFSAGKPVVLKGYHAATIIVLSSIFFILGSITYAVLHRKRVLQDLRDVDVYILARIAFAALVCGFLSNILWISLLKAHPVYVVTALSATTPIVTIILAALVLSEPVTIIHVIGILFMAVGAFLCIKS
ncbi:hypothetical protein CEUSTIGMA_g10730.t1 [Chlamydomonas eustigma]|uniref:EamA domain-containing protein n=1 Tax=Chlamydomonas eustigma TaxID=1157962 RepID=A0A250XJQ4_9CHLO|nr:hypothetical protein CEUSTIGMA_g10730.t1 [Chlamydomonas eustigma]|eukprot:GAX83304.1 hypothetical protein CEUSTIGMA_g10730.t1 [Chlamydomonas eustigma]